VTWPSVIIREIPRAQWPAFFDQFSRAHRAWLAELTTSEWAPDHADTSAHPLRSITPFVHNDRVVHIDIRFQDDTPGHEPLRIHAPIRARVEETTEGTAQGLDIVDAKGGSTHLRFRAAPQPDTLDGVAPGELS
jgi:hypothetical protein